ncbi:helix-turn-helix domain-containing protein [uncultured Umboniibacter sp.]|uniref:helix-turn-helix domain-containing protein n=1 Tax=uncultured Umboniibacter sp. TaxID=1798917 RepID=UPI002629A08A|nr:helix-turn-helix domain-containing protein [uncultured Umboniibacter sp.]
MSETEQNLNNFQRLGLKLASHREAAELTVEQLAQLLRVLPKVVTAIEAGDEAQLPTRVFILGYINSYIRALELDEGSFSDELAEVFPKPAEMSVSHRIDGGVDKSEIFNDQGEMPSWLKGLTLISVVLVIAAVLAYMYLRPANTLVGSPQGADRTEVNSEPLVINTDTSPVSRGASGLDASPDESVAMQTSPDESVAVQTSPDDSMTTQTSSGESQVAASDLPLAEPAPVGSELEANSIEATSNSDEATSGLIDPVTTVDEATVAPVIRETIVGASGQRLEMTFNAECWVEIKREDGSLLVGDLFNPNRRLVVNIDERVSILLGYGPAASVTYAGEVVDFRVRDNAAAFFYVGE